MPTKASEVDIATKMTTPLLYPMRALIGAVHALTQEIAWLRSRFTALRSVMPFRSAIAVMLTRRVTTVSAPLKATGSRCWFRHRSSDLACLQKVLFKQEYRLPFDLAPRVIVDAGANIGAASLYFATRFPEATILALEPEQSNFQLLRKNC